MAAVSLSAEFASLRWLIIRHGPNDERGFGLVTGLVAAAGVLALAVLARTGEVDPSWLTVGLSLFGLTWLLGPVLTPGTAPILNPEWFRTLPRRPTHVARELATSEGIGVGTVVTAVALCSLVVVAAPHGAGAVAVAVVAAAAQLSFLLWLGRCAAAATTSLLRSQVGTWVAATQMSALLALSFAGWVPLVALVLPDLGSGDTTIVVPSEPGAVPAAVEDVLLALPTGWGLTALGSAISPSASFVAVVAPLLGLVAGSLLLRGLWVVITAHLLRKPPARAQSNVTARRPRSTWSGRPGGPVRAVVTRELRTWFRDPHRRIALGHAWLTPVLMVVLVAPSGWSWAMPFVGVVAAGIAGMVAVNTYALDGTALWQLLTTPRAIRADVAGRQLAWVLLFGVPVVCGTVALCLASRSPFWAVALGMTLAATGVACACAPLFSALMPALGVDARDRVSATHDSGNPAGGQWTIFTAVGAGAALPVVAAQVSSSGVAWPVHLALGGVVGTGAVLLLTRPTQVLLERTGPRLLSAMAARDMSRLRTSATRPPAA